MVEGDSSVNLLIISTTEEGTSTEINSSDDRKGVGTEENRRNSLLTNFDPLSSSTLDVQSEVLEQQTENSEAVVKTNELPLVEMENSVNEQNACIEIPRSEGSGQRLNDTFTLTEPDSLTHDNFYSLDANNEQDESQNLTDELKAKVRELEGNIANNANHNEICIADYEQKLSAMTNNAEDWKRRAMALDRDKISLVRERDQARKDLHNVEAAFSDVHSKYERTKEVVQNNRINQQLLESRDLELQERLKCAHAHIAELEDVYKEKISAIYSNFEAKLKHQDLETTRLRAQLRKLQMKNETLENEVKQKTSEVAKLSSLCDELINKV